MNMRVFLDQAIAYIRKGDDCLAPALQTFLRALGYRHPLLAGFSVPGCVFASFAIVYKSFNASPPDSMDPQYSLPLPSRARIADQHRIPRMLHVPKLRNRPTERPNLQAINAAGFDSPQTKIQALLAKLSIVEAQNRALRSRCQQLETELDRVARSVGSSPSALRPPRPVQHRCTPRPGDMPPPLRNTSRTVARKESSEVERSSGFSSINDVLESYMGPTPTKADRTTPTSPNFSRPNPGRLVSEAF